MRGEARKELDRIEQLQPGEGVLESYAFVRGRGGPFDFHHGIAGGGLDYSHRISDSWSAFLRGEVGYRYGNNSGLEYTALGGLRLRF